METHLIVILKSKSDEVIYLFEIIRRVNQMWQFQTAFAHKFGDVITYFELQHLIYLTNYFNQMN